MKAGLGLSKIKSTLFFVLSGNTVIFYEQLSCKQLPGKEQKAEVSNLSADRQAQQAMP